MSDFESNVMPKTDRIEDEFSGDSTKKTNPRFEKRTIVAAALLQLMILVGIIIGKTVPFFGAGIVLLKVVPVDPRDLLRGDYVTLSYDFSRVPTYKFQEGMPVYVELVPDVDGIHYHDAGFLDAPPESGLYLKGTVAGFGRAVYGIETFYVEEGKGHDYENALRNGQVWAKIAITRGGDPKVVGLVIE